MDLDVFGESFAFEGEKIIEQTKEVLHCSFWVTGHVECHPPLDETHLELRCVNCARATMNLLEIGYLIWIVSICQHKFDPGLPLEHIQRSWDSRVAIGTGLLEKVLEAIAQIEDSAWARSVFQLNLPQSAAVAFLKLIPHIRRPFCHFVDDNVQWSAGWKTLGSIGARSGLHNNLSNAPGEFKH